MSLIEYPKKRKFAGDRKTSEPKGKSKNIKNKKLIYVIHKHSATHLHWDLRLEMGGVLKSWAIPKQPPATKKLKRLAIQVEDHPLEYASFKGIIPKGNYGAGEVEIWDKGTYEIKEKNKTKILINILGKKLRGKYALIKTSYGNKPEKSWLFFKTD